MGPPDKSTISRADAVFATEEVWSVGGLLTFYILFFLHLGTRRLWIAGGRARSNAASAWVESCVTITVRQLENVHARVFGLHAISTDEPILLSATTRPKSGAFSLVESSHGAASFVKSPSYGALHNIS